MQVTVVAQDQSRLQIEVVREIPCEKRSLARAVESRCHRSVAVQDPQPMPTVEEIAVKTIVSIEINRTLKEAVNKMASSNLRNIVVIESSLNPRTVSWAGAVGPWQLMPDEGKRFGLKRTNYSDERMDFYKSTHAACKLIKELHETFGDWLLVIAAYNGGVGRVKQCIRKAGGKKSFWDIQYFLPEETRNHVKKYIATHYIFEGSGGWTTMTAKETQTFLAARAIDNQEPILAQNDQFNTTVVEVGGRYLAVVVANYLLMDIDQFNKWNPAFDKTLASGKRYKMRLNKDRAVVFEAKKSQILLESVRTLINGEETVVASK